MKRRHFLQSTTAYVAGAALLPKSLSAAKKIAPSDKIRVASIGINGMGWSDLTAMLKHPEAECIALCDVDKNVLDKRVAELKQKNINVTAYSDYRKVLELKDVNAVIIGTPDHWHCKIMVDACTAGKDVYCEKPVGNSIAECRAMVAAQSKYNRVVQVGQWQHSNKHYQDAMDFAHSGKLGNVRLVKAWAYQGWMKPVPVQPDGQAPAGVDYDMWLGPAKKRPFNPNRFHFTFRWYWDYSGGLMTDWGAHMIDIANWGMGIKAPSSAASIGGKFGYPNDAMETPDTQQVMWSYPGFSMIWEHALGVGRGPEAREHGIQFHGEQGVLVVDRNSWEVFPETDRIDKPGRIYKSAGVPRRASSGDMHLLHVQNFIDCMRSRKRPNSDVEIGHNSMIACHLGNIAQRLGRQVKWDVDKEMIIGDKEAQSYVMR